MRVESPAHARQAAEFDASATEPSRSEVLAQLERLVHSIHFRNSKRYPALLRFVVERTLEGDADHLKERTLGVKVFGRQPDYDTNSDPIVRFTAGEIRKRIAQYYLTPEHEHELRFDLPLGSYVPHFLLPHNPPTTYEPKEPAAQCVESGVLEPQACEPLVPVGTTMADQAELEGEATQAFERKQPTYDTGLHPRLSNRWLVALAALSAILLAAGSLSWAFLRHQRYEVGSSPFWQPVLKARGACMVVLGVHSLDSEGRDMSPTSNVSHPDMQQSMLTSMLRSQMVPVSDVVSYGHLTTLLARNGHTCSTRSASATTLDQLRAQPIILIGGFDNIWTLRLTDGLRFHFAQSGKPVHEIVDSQNLQTRWMFDSAQNSLSSSVDYGIATGFFDAQIDQNVIVVAGIGKDGTEAAAEFVTNPNALAQWVTSQAGSHHHNYEVVLSTQIIEGQHGPPHIVGAYSW